MKPMLGERRALAAAVLSLYSFMFLLVAMAPPPGWGPAFGALAGVYGLGFLSLVAGYFWGRWYCIGLGMSGLVSAAISIWQVGMEPALVFYGATHGIISLVLWGNQMAAGFDGRTEWRDKFHMDESATHRLGKSVIRVGMSLPYIVLYALAPREDAGSLLVATSLVLVGAGIWGMLRLRTWGVFAVAAGALATFASLGSTVELAGFGNGYALNVTMVGLGAAAFLALAVAPFARPMLRWARGRA